jgi:hypothetical protein
MMPPNAGRCGTTDFGIVISLQTFTGVVLWVSLRILPHYANNLGIAAYMTRIAYAYAVAVGFDGTGTVAAE